MATKRRRTFRLAAWGLALAVGLAVGGCDRQPPETPGAMRLTSPAFRDGERMPAKYTGDGEDLSPPLEWTDPPEGTRTLALICDDLDAPRGTWNHWLLWNLPPDWRKVPEGIAKEHAPKTLGGGVQGRNSWPRLGYGGPTPPPGTGTHRYVFTLYALDRALDLAPGADKAALVARMEGHVLAKASLTGTYSHTR